jgi:hypothetical protein
MSLFLKAPLKFLPGVVMSLYFFEKAPHNFFTRCGRATLMNTGPGAVFRVGLRIPAFSQVKKSLSNCKFIIRSCDCPQKHHATLSKKKPPRASLCCGGREDTMMEDGAWLEASLAQILPDADADARDGTNPPSSFLIHLLVFATRCET